jgi:hypothetical protein
MMQFIIRRTILIVVFCGLSISLVAQSIRFPWNNYGHDAQHDAISPVASQSLSQILWKTSVDWSPQYSGDELFAHYGSPIVTRSNTVLVSVKTGASGNFAIESINGGTGTTNWLQPTDYILPPHGWLPSFQPALTPKNSLAFAGAGGTVYFCDNPDSKTLPTFRQVAFYGLTNYLANPSAYTSSICIDTPLTSDRYGNIFFGFQVNGVNPLNLASGIARIGYNGTGTWLAASNAANDTSISKVAQNCAPALSNDHKTLYFGVNSSSTAADFGNPGYLIALDSRTLTLVGSVRLKDPRNTTVDANVPDDATASPTVGPDGDVYYGVLENLNPLPSNHYRGWLLHFNNNLTQSKIPGSFGWDDTASIVRSSLVASYSGSSTYLVMTKYNNYAGGGGNGLNRIAILDPQNTEIDPNTGATVMKEVITMLGPTPDVEYTNSLPGAVREWCINTAAVDPFTKSILVNNEDGNIYRWNLTSNTLSETNVLTAGIGEAYTPTIIGVDGTVYAINNTVLYAIGHH